ncbi:MAG TPA: 3-hydroxyacyl-CoA dehydrogenase NAD-binding domain-containing protein [Steroidobacteraceae bacterium]|nr:3-hydroxyacyl-CoA dehydrogenase NAD-binding domain-containing protein [Steroidobacteraceae bacterium]
MSTGANWTLERDSDDVAWLGFDKQGSSANVLSRDIIQELASLLPEIEARPPRALVVFSAKSSGFIAGADIKDFTGLRTPEEAYGLIRAGQQVFDRIAALPCPTVAAIHGFALGGGLEIALACRYRVAANDGKVSLGLPEVQLGIHPGFGGTVRSVRLAGVRTAMDMMLTGRSYRAEQALAAGLVDRLVAPADLKNAAKAFALSAPAPRHRGIVDGLLNLGLLRGFLARALEKKVANRARRDHYPAPYAIIELWQRFGANGAQAFEAEARSIGRLMVTPTARSLVRVFFLQDRMKALGGKSPQEIGNVHVVGAGVMGGDIAAWCSLRGLNVTLQDRGNEFIEPALKRARELFAKRLKDPEQARAAAERLRADVAGDGVPQADVVIEAIFENVEAKRALYATLEPRMKAGAILATNTSSLMLETLAEQLADPSRLVGLHFFNPVAKMQLVEIIRTQATPAPILQAALAFTRRLDRLPLPCRSAPGFVVNRILMPYLNEALFAARDGVNLADIDECAVRFGMPMGPVELADTVGLDVCLHVGRILAQAFGREAPDQIAALVEAKQLGRKSGRGLYEWRDGKAIKPRRTGAPPADLEDRLILPMLNDAVACLREKVIEDADLLDGGVIFGTGFAPFRGGPLYYARERGPAAIVERLTALEARYGSRFRPDAGWTDL